MWEVNEKDWKLFRKKLPGWQEAYMTKLVEEYAQLLNSDVKASEKFWELDKRIRKNRKEVGVICEMRRSILEDNLACLVLEGAITMDDLDGFSDEMIELVKELVDRCKFTYGKNARKRQRRRDVR